MACVLHTRFCPEVIGFDNLTPHHIRDITDAVEEYILDIFARSEIQNEYWQLEVLFDCVNEARKRGKWEGESM